MDLIRILLVAILLMLIPASAWARTILVALPDVEDILEPTALFRAMVSPSTNSAPGQCLSMFRVHAGGTVPPGARPDRSWTPSRYTAPDPPGPARSVPAAARRTPAGCR